MRTVCYDDENTQGDDDVDDDDQKQNTNNYRQQRVAQRQQATIPNDIKGHIETHRDSNDIKPTKASLGIEVMALENTHLVDVK
jgi:hypothetical protein